MPDESAGMVDSAYQTLLRRPPTAKEVERWCAAFDRGKTFYDVFAMITSSPEFDKKRGVPTAYPAGHYYSPVVDPSTVVDYVAGQRAVGPHDIPGIALSTQAMSASWKSKLSIVRSTGFPDSPDAGHRFHYNNGSYPYGDAIMLRATIAELKPRRVIEIGSGYTTACALDTIDEFGLGTSIICIEPYADRLRSLLRPHDWSRVHLIESGVQTVDLTLFDDLDAGDILFIDSTHVVKTGSDVHYELFHILPRLKAGVFIHVHDVPYPFEYPDEWIFAANLSWNEAYALRAFLMYNSVYRIVMWNSLLARVHRADIAADFPLFLKNPGSSLWIEKAVVP